jgi:transcription-repair coupling factor (superfamily II helicase)
MVIKVNIYDYLSYTNSINDVINSNSIRIGDVCDEFNMTLIISDFYRGNKSLFVVLPNLYQAQKYYDALSNYIDEKDVLFFPADELLSAEIIAATGDFLFERINTITTLLEGNKKIIITNMNGAIKYEMSPSKWKKNIFRLKQYNTLDIYELCHKLISMGYESVFTIQKTGQFSRRGSIVDVFPLGYEKPIRIDFFGDEIDTIKYFSIDTQRSNEKIEEVSIIPVTELIYTNEEFALAKEKILSFIDSYSLSQIEEDMYNKNLFDLENHKNLESMARYITFFDDSKSTIFDFIENKRIYFVDPVKSKDLFNSIILDLNEYSSRLGGYSVCNMDLFKNLDVIISKSNVLIESLRSFDYVDKNIGAKSINPYLANKKNILKELTGYLTRTRLILAFRNEENYKKIYELFEEERIFIKRINSVSDINGVGIYGFIGDVASFELQNEGFVVINDRTLLDSNYQPKKAKYKSIFKKCC